MRIVVAIVVLLFGFGQLALGQAIGRITPGQAIGQDSLRNAALVKVVYAKRRGLLWLGDGGRTDSLRQALWQWIDSSQYFGLDSSRYHYAAIRGLVAGGAAAEPGGRTDTLFTDAALTFVRDLSEGMDIDRWLHYDELSAHSAGTADLSLTGAFAAIQHAAQLNDLFRSREPHTIEYTRYRQALRQELDTGNALHVKMLKVSLDYQRWIDHFNLSTFILVNIASATLRLYEEDSVRLQMKVVAGKPSTPTPRFSARCREVILYPYWNVPNRIATTEFLPLFKREPMLADLMGMEILDRNGKALDPNTLPWSTFGPHNFPYRLRQSTGCGNALGVIKFELTDPFDVFMHDTNLKSAFGSTSRYYSHGCIRLEKPFLLARELLGEQLDTMYLSECRRDQHPKSIPLEHSVPVLVVYMPVEIDTTGNLRWYKDEYHLLKHK
ncbi:MAG TPA: L,D-transpeptidase family protein [Puia sp.]|nr:L,D-transpeptidase family protein [Puia sp.]